MFWLDFQRRFCLNLCVIYEWILYCHRLVMRGWSESKHHIVVNVDKFASIRSSIIHYSDFIMSAMASQITGVSIVCLTASSGADQRKHQSSASLAFVRGIHRWPEGPVTQKMFPFDDVIMRLAFSWALRVYHLTEPVCSKQWNQQAFYH